MSAPSDCPCIWKQISSNTDMMPGGRYIGTKQYYRKYNYIIAHIYLALNEFTDYFVVEIINWGPLDTLLNILFLFCFQCQFNENLLKLLINKINTKLFKSIFLKYKNN